MQRKLREEARQRAEYLIQLEEYKRVATYKFYAKKSLPHDVAKLQAIIDTQQNVIASQQKKIEFWKSEVDELRQENLQLLENINKLQKRATTKSENSQTDKTEKTNFKILLPEEDELDFTEDDLIEYLRSLGNFTYRDHFGCNSKPERMSQVLDRTTVHSFCMFDVLGFAYSSCIPR